MQPRRFFTMLAALLPLIGCKGEPTQPELQIVSALPTCAECPPTPQAGQADFAIGEPQFLDSSTFEVSLFVNTSQDIIFSQFTVDYRSDCVEFLQATRGDALPPGGTPTVNDGAGTASFPVNDPEADRHVLVNILEDYGPGCGQEIIVLRFRAIATPLALCSLRWDDSSPPGNPPNHLLTAEPSEIRPQNIEFCDQFVFIGDRGTDCDCTPPPPLGAADFAIGPPLFLDAQTFEVGLRVNTSQNIRFSQFTVDYRSDCLQFLQAMRGSALPPGGSPPVNDGPGTPSFPVNDPASDRHVLVNILEDYGPGCGQEIIVLRFGIVATPPGSCSLRWDDSFPLGNPPNHLLTDVPSEIRPETILFCDRDIDFPPPDGEFTMIGINDNTQVTGVDQLTQIPNVATGVAQLIGSLGDDFRRCEALATRIMTGELTRVFAVDHDRLLEIDPATGVGTPIGPIGFGDVDGIAFDPQTGVLYGATYASNQIITIDISTGQGTLERSGVAAGDFIEDMAFHPNGDLYVLTDDPGVVRVDLTTGDETTWQLTGALSLESLLWSMDGTTLYSAADRGSHKDLVTIDLNAGTITFVSSQPSGFRDLEGLGWIESNRLP